MAVSITMTAQDVVGIRCWAIEKALTLGATTAEQVVADAALFEAYVRAPFDPASATAKPPGASA